jgi:endonuclease YncB( thermonuclease family)
MTHRLILLAAALVLGGCTGAADAPADVAARPAQQVEVLAGDLLHVGGRTVRIANIRTPALPPKARCWGEAALAVQAAARAEALVQEASSVKLTPEGRDADGVALARVALGGKRDLGEALIFAGLAARRGDQAWDWCGPADFHASGGPAFDRGPEANSEFMAWVAAEQERHLQDNLARMMMEAGAPADPLDGL